MRPGLPRKVLIVSRVGFLGGVERTILTLLEGLSTHGFAAVLACPPQGTLADAARALGVELAACPFDRLRITLDPRVLARYPLAWRQGSHAVELHCRERGIDVIHAHHPVGALYARRATRRLRIPMVLHMHETLPARRLYAIAMRFAIQDAAGILCVSRAAYDLAISIGAPPARTRVVHNGVDQRFFGNLSGQPVPDELRQAGMGPHIGLFGVLEPRKAQHHFLEAAALLTERFPEARFWLIGTAALKDKASYAARLRQMAATPPLRGRVILQDFQADVARWIGAMDVVVQCSVSDESFGMALAEALVIGRPVVATRVGGMPEVVRDGETGLIVPPNDPAALAAALTRLLEAPALREAFASRGRQDARTRFTPTVYCGAVAAAYASALREEPGMCRATSRRSMTASLL
jgi:glycosyltransferase involved in cell wall biosynthesis